MRRVDDPFSVVGGGGGASSSSRRSSMQSSSLIHFHKCENENCLLDAAHTSATTTRHSHSHSQHEQQRDSSITSDDRMSERTLVMTGFGSSSRSLAAAIASASRSSTQSPFTYITTRSVLRNSASDRAEADDNDDDMYSTRSTPARSFSNVDYGPNCYCCLRKLARKVRHVCSFISFVCLAASSLSTVINLKG